jgi:hypothetical protein
VNNNDNYDYDYDEDNEWEEGRGRHRVPLPHVNHFHCKGGERMTTAMLLPSMHSGCMRSKADDRCVLDDETGRPNLTQREEGGGGAMARKEVTQQSKNGGGKRDYGKRRGRGNWVGRGESQSSRGALRPANKGEPVGHCT